MVDAATDLSHQQLLIGAGMSSQEFAAAYSAGQPLVLGDVQLGPALGWNPEYLASVLDGVAVEVMSGRNAYGGTKEQEIELSALRTWVPFSEYVAGIWTPGNDAYLTANNDLLQNPQAAALWRDLHFDPRYLDPAPSSGVFVWVGPAGTVTPLHYDVTNILFTQLYGSKRWNLIPPSQGGLMYNSVGVYSDVNLLAPDPHRHPLFWSVTRYEFELGPGDSVFIPAGWWHHVVALEPSISVSTTNFRWPNPSIAAD